MPPGDADRIRQYLCQQVEEARKAGKTNVTFRAGSVRQAIAPKPPNPAVCSILESKNFHKQVGIEFESYVQRPPSGSGGNLEIAFKVLPQAVNQVRAAPEPSEQVGAGSTETDPVDAAEHTSSPPVFRPNEMQRPRPLRETISPGADIGDRLKERLLKLTPAQFEDLLGEYFAAKGFSEVEVTGRTNDGGIDGTCQIPFLKLRIAFQAKRYQPSNNIGIEPVQRLNGSLAKTYERGVFVTTSSFSRAASGWVQEANVPITLVDGDKLVQNLIELGLGVREVPVVRTEVDEKFFKKFED